MRKLSYRLFGGIAVFFCVAALAWPAFGGQVVRRELEPGVYALLRSEGTIGLEMRAPGGSDARRVLTKYLAIESEWSAYRGRQTVFIPYHRLKQQMRREVLLAVFENDVIDADGWWHTVVFDQVSIASVSEWITGRSTNARSILADPRNSRSGPILNAGDRVLIPAPMLHFAMRKHTPKRLVEPPPSLVETAPSTGELLYGRDREGEFAVYRLQRGETLYSHVVAKYTDYREAADILEACNRIAARSGIKNVRDIDTGAKIVVPAEMLSPKYLPRGAADREQYEATIIEAEKIRGIQGRSRDLSDVVVILDAGHGGKDNGAIYSRSGLYEDEINYDIVNRIKRILESETGARVYTTVRDRSTGSKVSDARRFDNDTDEELLTSPPHTALDGSSTSVNLRWMLVNSIYAKELRNKTDPNKVIFTSVHTDSLYESLRGVMIYIPGAHRRNAQEARSGNVYTKYAEGKTHSRFASTDSERKRDEAMSRNFADVVLDEFGNHRVKRHDKGDPIRSQIVRDRKPTLPGILRNNDVPTKILIETANINNPTDRDRLSDPEWRELFARAYVAALRRHFQAESPARLAQTD